METHLTAIEPRFVMGIWATGKLSFGFSIFLCASSIDFYTLLCYLLAELLGIYFPYILKFIDVFLCPKLTCFVGKMLF